MVEQRDAQSGGQPYQPELEGFGEAYSPQPGDQIPPEKIAAMIRVVEQAGVITRQTRREERAAMAREANERNRRAGKASRFWLRSLGN